MKIISTVILIFIITSCSKKTVPARASKIIYNNSPVSGVITTRAKEVTPSSKIEPTRKVGVEEPVRAPVKESESDFPKTISVNDDAASKSVDGRLYYDLKGHRYWKNYKDGKYYLFDKSMYNNPDFKPGNN